MLISKGSRLGTKENHECIRTNPNLEYLQVEIQSDKGVTSSYPALRCRQCGYVCLRKITQHMLNKHYRKNYQIETSVKRSSQFIEKTSRKLNNADKANISSRNKIKRKETSKGDYVLRGEVPPHMQWNALHPFQGGAPK